MADKEAEDDQVIIDRINAALPALIENLNNEPRLPWVQGLTLADLTISHVPPTFVTGGAFDVAVLNAVHFEAGNHVRSDLLTSRLLVIESEGEEQRMIADLCIKNRAEGTLGISSIEFDWDGNITDIFHPMSFEEGEPLGENTNWYIQSLVTESLLNSADDKEPASGTRCTLVDGINLYKHKELFNSATGYMDSQVQLAPRTMPRLRNDLAKEMRNYGARTPFPLTKENQAYFAEIGDSLASTNEMWWVSEDMSKLAWDVIMSGTEPDDLTENELPAPAGIMWLNGGGGPVLTTKLLPEGDFLETGITKAELMSIDAIIWYTPTVRIPGLHVGKARFMGLTASPGLARETSQWNSILSPVDLESNEIEFHRTPTYVTYYHLKYLPRKMALVVMRLAREETVGEKTSATVGGSPNKKKNRNRRIETVTCASLRRHRYLSEAEREADVREYSHRWIVRGHMRNQPIGPRNIEGGQKHQRVWIAPYVKGPEDKPLVLKDRVQLFISSGRNPEAPSS